MEPDGGAVERAAQDHRDTDYLDREVALPKPSTPFMRDHLQDQFDQMEEVEADADAATGYVAERARERGLSAVEHTSAGRPHEQVADHADDHDVDLVVMGSHGRPGARRALLGSVTERVLRETHVPVLVVDVRRED